MSALPSAAKRLLPSNLTAESMPSILNFHSGSESLMPDLVRSSTVLTGYGSPEDFHARLSAGRTTQCIADTTEFLLLFQVPGSRQPTSSILAMYSSIAFHSFQIDGPLGTTVACGSGSSGG